MDKDEIINMLDEEYSAPSVPKDDPNEKWRAAESTPWIKPTTSSTSFIGLGITEKQWKKMFGKKK